MMIRKLKAWWYEVPYEIDDYWPAFRSMERDRPYLGHEAILITTKKSVGDIVGALHDYKGTVHFYEITGKWRSPGSDHVINPTKFSLKYHHTEKIDPEDYEVEEGQVFTPDLLTINK